VAVTAPSVDTAPHHRVGAAWDVDDAASEPSPLTAASQLVSAITDAQLQRFVDNKAITDVHALLAGSVRGWRTVCRLTLRRC
jgi:hypothetical protein